MKGDPETSCHFASYFTHILNMKLRTRLRCAQWIDEVRQETMTRVLHIVRKGDVKDPQRLGGLVNSVCEKVLMETFRGITRYEHLDENDEHEDTTVQLDAPLVRGDLQRMVDKVLDKLPKKDRDMLNDVYRNDVSQSEYCRQAHVNPDYLRVKLFRARKLFVAEYLRQAEHDPSMPPPKDNGHRQSKSGRKKAKKALSSSAT
jgi:RNA polymerase sigma-70 factor (ECF subfamily)